MNEKKAKGFLREGEEILWSGAPEQGVLFRRVDAFIIPFSILWGGFALFWNVSVWLGEGPFFFKLWGLPFLVFGLYITVGRFYHDAWRRSKTVYALTDQRAIIATRVGGELIRSIAVGPHMQIEIEQGKRTSVYFGQRTPIMQQFQSIGALSGASNDFVFEHASDGKQLLACIDALTRPQ